MIVKSDFQELLIGTPIYAEPYRIMSHEVDPFGLVRIDALAGLLHETAWRHVEQNGLGFQRLRRENRLWVIARLKIEMSHYPARGEMILIRTWPRKCDRLFAYRDFQILDSREQVLATATGMWVIIDHTTRKPVAMTDYRGKLLLHKETLMDDALHKIHLGHPMQSISLVQSGWSDLDFNHHINNMNLIRWTLNAVPVELMERTLVKTLVVNYLGEGLLGSTIEIRQSIEDDSGVVGTCIFDEYRELARLQFVMSKRPCR
ncbi:hypothetical protein JW823_06590 [bacterium]|nr:hypothetical protein [candidate division CSSED10-310 bacterium]